MDPAIRLENVTRSFRGFLGQPKVRAVTQLSLSIFRGDVFGLLGPNGSGKTTSLLMMLGLLRPDSGRIEILGSSPGDPSVRRRIGYLPEEFSPPEYLSGEEILRFYGGLLSMDSRSLERRIDELLSLLDLQEARTRRFREYSKGMRRRIGLAQALLHDPEIMVLDEPTDGLDPIAVGTVKAVVRDLQARQRTILIASHILPEVEEICHRFAILHRGACLCSGKTDELLSSLDKYQLVVEGSDGKDAQRAAQILRDSGYRVSEVKPVRDTLEHLFLRTVEEGQKNPPG